MTPLTRVGDNFVAGPDADFLDLAARTVFVLDWDGTLFDSMAIKLESFAHVVSTRLRSLGAGVAPEEAKAIYQGHSGKPRRELFTIVAHTHGIQLKDTDMDSMSEQLTELNHAVLAGAHLFDDTIPLLERLLLLGRTPYVSSSVPQVELDHFTSLKLPSELLASLGGVFGSQSGFGKGPQHLSRIMEIESRSAANLIMIGDDEADFSLSTAAGVDCILVNRTNREIPAGIPAIPNLIALCEQLT